MEKADVAVFLINSSGSVIYRSFFFSDEISGRVRKRPQRRLASMQAAGDLPVIWDPVKESALGTSVPIEISVPLVVARRFPTRASDLAATGSIYDDTITKILLLLPITWQSRYCRVYYNGYQNDGGSWDSVDCWLTPDVRVRYIIDGQDVKTVTTLNFVGPK